MDLEEEPKTWRELWEEQKNYGNYSNICTFLVTLVGLYMRFTFGSEDLATRYILSYGLMGFAGGLTNAIAVKMLFDKIPGIYGSGVFQRRYKDIRLTMKNTMMKSFFVQETMKSYLAERVRSLDMSLITQSARDPSVQQAVLEHCTKLVADKWAEGGAKERAVMEAAIHRFNAYYGDDTTPAPRELDDQDVAAMVKAIRPYISKAAKSMMPVAHDKLRLMVADPKFVLAMQKAVSEAGQDMVDQMSASVQVGSFGCQPAIQSSMTPLLARAADAETLKAAARKAVDSLDFPALFAEVEESEEVWRNLVSGALSSPHVPRDVVPLVRSFAQQGNQPMPELSRVAIDQIISAAVTAAIPVMQEGVVSMITDERIRKLRFEVNLLLEDRLSHLNEYAVKRMVEEVIRKHCQWLVVWGNVFGGFIGILSAAFELL